MAESGEIISSFLVSLGYVVDPSQQAKFDAALKTNAAATSELDKQLKEVTKSVGLTSRAASQINLGHMVEDIKKSAKQTEEFNKLLAQAQKQFSLTDQETKKLGVTLQQTFQNNLEAHARNVNNFNSTLKNLGVTGAATIAAFTAGFADLARQGQQLYYMSQRTGQSAKGLETQQFLGGQFGGQSFTQAQEALSTAARNPGYAAMIRNMGVANNDIYQFLDALRQFPPVVQDIYANMLGVSTTLNRTYQANRGEILQEKEENEKRWEAAGLGVAGYKKYTEDADAVVKALGVDMEDFKIIGVQSFEAVSGPAIKFLKELDDILQKVIEFNKNNPWASWLESLAAIYASLKGIQAIAGAVLGLGSKALARGGAATAGAAEVGAAGAAAAGAGAIGIGGLLGTLGLGFGAYEGFQALTHPEDPTHPYGSSLTGYGKGQSSYLSPENIIRRLGLVGNSDEHKDNSDEPKDNVPKFAGGGIVRADLHAGEMVLPPELSLGLQDLINSMSNRPQQGDTKARDYLEYMVNWLTGSTSYIPIVKIEGQSTDQQPQSPQDMVRTAVNNQKAQVQNTVAGGATASSRGGFTSGAAARATAERLTGQSLGLQSPGLSEQIAAGQFKPGALPEAVSHMAVGPGFAGRSAALMHDLVTKFGLNPTQAAGLIGNLGYESSGLTPGIHEQGLPGNQGGLGYAQWTGSRRREFEAWAAKNNLDVHSEAANRGFLENELSNTPVGRATIAALKKSQTLQQSTLAGENTFEKPANPAASFSRRLSWAQQSAALGEGTVLGGDTANNNVTNTTHNGGDTNVSQTNHIYGTGSNDQMITALNDHAGRLSRNFQITQF